MQLQPGEIYYFARQLDNSQDPATYYVRAVVKDNRTDTVLATINLTDKGSQRFIGSYTVPSAVGNGFYISITSFVYTDSGYTTLSPVYSTVVENHLIQNRFSTSFGYGGDSVVSSEQLKKAIGEAISLIPAPKTEKVKFPKITFPEFPKYDGEFSSLKEEMKSLGLSFEKQGGMTKDSISSAFENTVQKIAEALDGHYSRQMETFQDMFNRVIQQNIALEKMLKDVSGQNQIVISKGASITNLIEESKLMRESFANAMSSEKKKSGGILKRIRESMQGEKEEVPEVPKEYPLYGFMKNKI